LIKPSIQAVEGCRNHLHGRVVMSKGDKSLTTRDVSLKLQALWQNPRRIVPLGCGCYELTFNTPDDKKNAWYLGTYNLKLEILHFLEL
jgi:hypothetical protein